MPRLPLLEATERETQNSMQPCENHGKVFCCECRYGKLGHIDHKERYRDTLTEMRQLIKVRLAHGFNGANND